MAIIREEQEWKSRWQERGKAIRSVLGDTEPRDSVVPFSWEEFTLPGACALTFKPTPTRIDYLSMTLGLTQPLRATDHPYSWEFVIRTQKRAKWPADLLYQLVTQWLCEKGDMGFGYRLPMVFFTDHRGNLWAGLTDDVAELNLVGSIAAMYLWTDEMGLSFRVSTGTFRLLTVIAVTKDEDRLAQESTPAHLLLLLRRLGISQVCDPQRQSILAKPDSGLEWAKIQTMTHEDAFDELQGNT